MAMAYRPDDADPEVLRKLLLGALRFGKPFVVDMLSLELSRESLSDLFDPIQPGLLELLLSKAILREEHYAPLIRAADGEQYLKQHWRERALAAFHFIILTKQPRPPEWCKEQMFVLKVA